MLVVIAAHAQDVARTLVEARGQALDHRPRLGAAVLVVFVADQVGDRRLATQRGTKLRPSTLDQRRDLRPGYSAHPGIAPAHMKG
jgi:hypothetical protein